MACKLQASVDKGPPSPKTCPGTRGVLYGGEKLNRTLKKIGSLMTENYGNMPAQLLDRIGWRHLELGSDFSMMTMFSAITLNFTWRCTVITLQHLLRQIYQFWMHHSEHAPSTCCIQLSVAQEV